MIDKLRTKADQLERYGYRFMTVVLAAGAVASGGFAIASGTKVSQIDHAAEKADNLSDGYMNSGNLDASANQDNISANLDGKAEGQIDNTIGLGLLTVMSAGVALIASAGPKSRCRVGN